MDSPVQAVGVRQWLQAHGSTFWLYTSDCSCRLAMAAAAAAEVGATLKRFSSMTSSLRSALSPRSRSMAALGATLSCCHGAALCAILW